MKTTVELSDALFEQAKLTAKQQGISLRTLFERGLRMAMQPPEIRRKPAWPDLSFRPSDPEVLMPAEQWRDVVNETPGWKVS